MLLEYHDVSIFNINNKKIEMFFCIMSYHDIEIIIDIIDYKIYCKACCLTRNGLVPQPSQQNIASIRWRWLSLYIGIICKSFNFLIRKGLDWNHGTSTSRRAGPPWLSCGESHELKVCSVVETSRSANFCASQSHYPLVNSHITMENHHFQWENPL